VIIQIFILGPLLLHCCHAEHSTRDALWLPW
jgi:hypothetical protein